MVLRAFLFASIVAGCSAGASGPPMTEEPSPATGETVPVPAVIDGGRDAATDDGAVTDSSIVVDASPSQDAQVIGIDGSTTCTPIFPPITACSVCINDLCTTELASCNGDCDCIGASACNTDCVMATDYAAMTACMDACKMVHPVGSAKLLTFAKCSYEKCSATSDGGTGACP